MDVYEQHLESILHFVTSYQKLVDCHLVDFFTESLWDRCVPKQLKTALEEAYVRDLACRSVENIECTELNEFISQIKSLSLENCSDVTASRTLFDQLAKCARDKNLQTCTKMEFMNRKKSHEVKVLGDFVGGVAESLSGLVIDSGAGKAYLSMYLAANYQLPVLAIDSSNICQRGAMLRQEKMKRKHRTTSHLIRYIVQEVRSESDVINIIMSEYAEHNLKRNLILTGLHTCGSLAHSIIKTFLCVAEIKFLCIVPCCYHLMNEPLHICKLSRNARMLAQQSIERNTAGRGHGPSTAVFYRALLQILLRSKGLSDARVGRGGPSDDFPTYARWALRRIGVDSQEMPIATALQQLHDSHINSKWKLELFQTLRIYLASLLEAALLLDNVVFIRKNCQQSMDSTILRLFDPVVSPRRYAIVAKRQ